MKKGTDLKKQEHTQNTPPHLSNMAVLLLWLGHVWLPVELADWQLLMISVLTAETGWIQMHTRAFSVFSYSEIDENSQEGIKSFPRKVINIVQNQPKSFSGWEDEDTLQQAGAEGNYPRKQWVLFVKRAKSPTQFYFVVTRQELNFRMCRSTKCDSRDAYCMCISRSRTIFHWTRILNLEAVIN